MTKVEIQVMELVNKLFRDPRVDFTLDTELDLLDLDSLSYTEFIIECEDRFGIEIDLDDPKIKEWTTLRDLCNEISRLLN